MYGIELFVFFFFDGCLLQVETFILASNSLVRIMYLKLFHIEDGSFNEPWLLGLSIRIEIID